MEIDYIGRSQWIERVERSKVPVLVEFMTQTCPVCRSMAPAVDELAQEYSGKILVLRVDAQREQALAMSFGIQGVPTFKFFCGGKPIAEMAGGVYPSLLKQMVEHALESGEACASKRTKINYEITGYG